MPPKIPASVDYEIDAATGWPADELRRAIADQASRKLREIERDLLTAARAPYTLTDAFAEASLKSLPRQIALARQNTK